MKTLYSFLTGRTPRCRRPVLAGPDPPPRRVRLRESERERAAPAAPGGHTACAAAPRHRPQSAGESVGFLFCSALVFGADARAPDAGWRALAAGRRLRISGQTRAAAGAPPRLTRNKYKLRARAGVGPRTAGRPLSRPAAARRLFASFVFISVGQGRRHTVYVGRRTGCWARVASAGDAVSEAGAAA